MSKIIHKYFSFSIVLFFLGIGFAPSSSAFANLSLEAETCNSSGCQVLPTQGNQQIFSGSLQIGQEFALQISLKNTSGKPIYSVSSWLFYDPEIFEVTKLDEADSSFPLSAPGEFTAVPSEKIIKIGRAVTGLPVTLPRANVAKIFFRVRKNPNGSKISFVDFRKNDVGKTAALTIENMLPENILPNTPLDIVFNTAKGAPSGNVLGESSQTSTTPTNQNIYGVQNPYAQHSNTPNISNTPNVQIPNNYSTATNQLLEIPRPQGFRSRTYSDGRVEHLWKMGEDSRIRGYYLYYSSTSGVYMHRKDIGKTNTAVFPKDFFEKGRRIYFAVQAYDSAGKISDFSDETYVVVGTSGSESHPFFEQIFPNVDPNNAVIIKDKNGNIVYKGTRKPGSNYGLGKNEKNYSANITTAKDYKNYPTPKQNVQSGMKIPTNFLFLLAGIFLIFSFFIPEFSEKKKIIRRNSPLLG